MSSTDAIPSDELLAVAGEAATSYPPPRAGTELILTEINPHRAHACWHIDPADIEDARQRAPSAPLVVRTHDITGIDFNGTNPHDTNDTVVHGNPGQADVHLRRTGRTYLAELGLRRPDGHLERLAVSDPIELQQATPPAYIPQPVASDIGTLAGEEMAGLAAQPLNREAPGAAPAKVHVTLATDTAPWPDAEELANLVPDRSEYVEAWYDRFSSIGAGIEAADASMRAEIADVPFEALPADTSTLKERFEAAEQTPAQPSDTSHPVHVSSSEPQVIRIEDYLSSPGAGPAHEDVVVTAELTIRGRIPRGRRATLFGQDVSVDADGGFELRRKLTHPGSQLPVLMPQTQPAQD